MNSLPQTAVEWTRKEFRKMLGEPLVPMCPICKGVGDHRLKDGIGFYCEIDHTKQGPAPIPDGWQVITGLMSPPIFKAELYKDRDPVESSKWYKTKEEAEDYITHHTKPHHELDPE